MNGGTARRHTFKIFGSVVFRVALRIGTKLGSVSAPRSMIMIAITLYNDWPQ